jgi:hypothetical protein
MDLGAMSEPGMLQHKQQGGSRANLLWPLVITLGVLVMLAVAIVTYESVTGQTLDL